MITDKPIVIVRWDDAQASSTKVITENDPTYHQPVVMETLGWLLKDDEKGISVVTEVFFEDGLFNYRGHTFVPRSLVLSSEILKVPTPPKQKRSRKRANPRPSEAVPPGDVSEVHEPDRS